MRAERRGISAESAKPRLESAVDESAGHMKRQPTDTPDAQQDKKQNQKKKISKHSRFP
jgi:hypothetical protein